MGRGGGVSGRGSCLACLESVRQEARRPGEASKGRATTFHLLALALQALPGPPTLILVPQQPYRPTCKHPFHASPLPDCTRLASRAPCVPACSPSSQWPPSSLPQPLEPRCAGQGAAAAARSRLRPPAPRPLAPAACPAASRSLLAGGRVHRRRGHAVDHSPHGNAREAALSRSGAPQGCRGRCRVRLGQAAPAWGRHKTCGGGRLRRRKARPPLAGCPGAARTVWTCEQLRLGMAAAASSSTWLRLAAPHHRRCPLPLQVGRPCAEAKAAIEAQFPNLRVFIVPEGAMVTMDFQTDRVRIYCSAAGTVASPPRIG